MTEHMPWEPRRIGDNNKSWAVIGHGPVGDTIIAGYIRDEDTANLIRLAPDMLEALKDAVNFAAKITDVSGPYPYVNGTGLIADAYKQERKLRAIIGKADGK